METPSTRRMTRSQTKAGLSNPANINISSRKLERSALNDITNDSPIAGIESVKTPVSSMANKKSSCYKGTPGSGETLLRGQVKNLLQKVEEEGGEVSKVLSFDCSYGPGVVGNHGLKGLFNTPGSLLAPTPANTPQVLNFDSSLVDESLAAVAESPIEDQLTVSKVLSGISEGNQQSECGTETEKDEISRSLFLDFAEKSDSSDCSSGLTYQGIVEGSVKGCNQTPPLKGDDDDASLWSVQVNVSTRDEDEDNEEVIEDDLADDFNYEDADEEGAGDETYSDFLDVDELCEGMKSMSVNSDKEGARFMGKHVRFVYNSDNELDVTEVLHLKGVPTSQGKHFRFHEEEDNE